MSISAEEIKSLEERIKAQENRKAMAEGAMAQIQERWKVEHGTDDPAEVAKIVAQMAEDIKTLDASIQAGVAEVRTILAVAEGVK